MLEDMALQLSSGHSVGNGVAQSGIFGRKTRGKLTGIISEIGGGHGVPQ